MIDDVSNPTTNNLSAIQRLKATIVSTMLELPRKRQIIDFTLGDQESEWFEFLRCCLHDKLLRQRTYLKKCLVRISIVVFAKCSFFVTNAKLTNTSSLKVADLIRTYQISIVTTHNYTRTYTYLYKHTITLKRKNKNQKRKKKTTLKDDYFFSYCENNLGITSYFIGFLHFATWLNDRRKEKKCLILEVMILQTVIHTLEG